MALHSFGTDSPLDKDIKERLMQQVFSVLPVLPDDQSAYAAHHKSESEKRLIAQRQAQNAARQQQQQPPPRKAFPKVPEKKKDAPNNDPNQNYNNNSEASGISVEVDNSNSSSDNGPGDADKATAMESPDANNNHTESVSAENSVYLSDEVTPERLEEIKKLLAEIYAKYSPEKISKIDRLLAKYTGHEEEFLRFVFEKYNVPLELYKPPRSKSLLMPEKEDGSNALDSKSEADDQVKKDKSTPNLKNNASSASSASSAAKVRTLYHHYHVIIIANFLLTSYVASFFVPLEQQENFPLFISP